MLWPNPGLTDSAGDFCFCTALLLGALVRRLSIAYCIKIMITKCELKCPHPPTSTPIPCLLERKEREATLFLWLYQCCARLLFFIRQGVAIFINSVMLDIDAVMESSNHILLGMCLIFHIYIQWPLMDLDVCLCSCVHCFDRTGLCQSVRRLISMETWNMSHLPGTNHYVIFVDMCFWA